MTTSLQWLARGLRTLPDSTLGYSAGLAALWAPVVFLAQTQIDDLRHHSHFGLKAVITSIIGMLVGGGIIYHATRNMRGPPRPRERAVILTLAVPFYARQPVSDDRARTTYWVGFVVVVIAVLAAYLNLTVLVIEEMGRIP